MFKSLVVLSALLAGSAAIAHADSLNGDFSVFGADSFTWNTTFTAGSVTFGATTVQPLIDGNLATYIRQGDAVTFLPGALPFTVRTNIPPDPPFAGHVRLTIFTIFDATSNETFTFNMTSYTAGFDTSSPACSAGVCLALSINGYMTAAGPVVLDQSGAALGTTTLQYVSRAFEGQQTTFSGQVTVAPAVTPEPSSLALLGTGMLGVIGMARRKFNV